MLLLQFYLTRTYVDKDTGIGYILVNTKSPANSTKAGVIGTIAEEQSHVIGKKEGRQKVVPDGSEKGLESLGRPTNDYFKKQYSKNDKAIGLKSDGRDYSNVDFGEHVGDKVVKNPLKSYGREFITTDERKQAEKILSKEKGNRYIIDWVRYDNITETNYRAKINYLVFEAKNRVNDLSEIEKGNFEDVNDKEAVYHNFTEDGKIILDDNMKNQKKVEYETGREVVITPNDEIVKESRNQGTGNYITYGLKESKSDEGKFDKFGHGIVDIGTYLFFGTGVNDNSTFINRISYFTKGTLVSINYKGIKKWSDSRGYKAVGYKEIFEYLITPNFYEQYRDDTRYKNFIETNIIR